MSLNEEERASRMKLAQLVAAFDEDLDEEFIEAILQTKGDIKYAAPMDSTTNADTYTILHKLTRLSKNKTTRILRLLLRHGIDITRTNNKNQTALHSMIEKHLDRPVVESILSVHVDHSIRANPCDDNGITHFHIACMAKHTKAVEFFLDNEVDTDQTINRDSSMFPGFSPLHLAVHVRCQETAKKLLDHGANVCSRDAQELTPVQVLINRNMELANSELLEDHRKFVPEHKINQKMIHLLSTSARDINSDNNGNQIVTDEYGFSKFHAACTIHDISLAKSLLTGVDDVNQTISIDSPFCPGYSPLHFAAHFSFELVTMLLAKRANLMAKDANGLTPLDVCLQRYPIEDVIHILSTQPAWKDIVLSDNRTKLFDLLRAMESEAAYRSLLDRIEDVNCHVNGDSPLWPGYTILHFAVLFSERPQARTYLALRASEGDDLREEDWLNLTMIQESVANGADYTIQDSRGMTPLHLAFYLQKKNTLSVFLDNEREITIPVDENNLSHLHVACAKGAYGTVRNLVLNGADVSLTTRSPIKTTKFIVAPRSTPLHLAVANGDAEIAKFLMQHGADLNATNDEGWSPLHYVMLLKDPGEMGEALLEFSANLREKVVEGVGLSHLHVACRVECLESVKKLIELGSDVNASIKCDPKAAPESTFRLLGQSDHGGLNLLNIAIKQQSVELANILLKAGADIFARNAKGVPPLYDVLGTDIISCKFIGVFSKQLEKDAVLRKRVEEESGITLLHVLAFMMNVEGVKEALKNGADVNAKMHSDVPDNSGDTVLHRWAYGSLDYEYGSEDVRKTLRLLVEAGADLMLTDNTLRTPLHCFNECYLFDYPECFDEDTMSTGRSLLRRQKDFSINPISGTGVSHFHITVRMCDVDVVEEFLKHGVDVNQRVDYFSSRTWYGVRSGCTPLHLFAYESSTYLQALPDRRKTLDLLLRYGADVRACDVFGNTPLHAIAETEFAREDFTRKMVGAGGNVHVANNAGETPFAVMLKLAVGSPREVDFFLRQGCRLNDYNAVNQTGFLALPLCSRYQYHHSKEHLSEFYEMLFKNPDVTSTDEAGRSLIHNVVSSRADRKSNVIDEVYVEVIERLVKLGCDIDAQDHTGKTALHTAAQFKNYAAVAALLTNGADVNVVDNNKKSAVDYALDFCDRCNNETKSHRHLDLIETIAMHVLTLQHARLDVSNRNESLAKIVKLNERSMGRLVRVKTQLEGTKTITVVPSSSLKLYDFLSETGTVAAYPTMSGENRRAVEKFFTARNEVLAEFDLLTSLFRLQYKKLVKRAALVYRACYSLRGLSGIELPELCSERLLRYLSFYDVQNVVAAMKNS